MDDEISGLYNSHGYERLARWGYGLLQVYDEVDSVQGWKGDKKQLKTRWALLARFHPTEAKLIDGGNEEATEEVTDGMKKDALFKKWLEKSDVV
jgi:hypothetical protein